MAGEMLAIREAPQSHNPESTDAGFILKGALWPPKFLWNYVLNGFLY